MNSHANITKAFISFVGMCFIAVIPSLMALNTQVEGIRIIRDHWGIPHIFAKDERSLFYGAGYAAAEDRLFQMTLVRFSIQGRLAEVFGTKYLEWDKRLRTMGLYRHARASLHHLSPTIQALLHAYAMGVNAYMADHPNHLSTLFMNYGGSPEPWTAADCIAAMLRIAERFDRSWMQEVFHLRQFEVLADSIGREAAIRQLESQKRQVDDEVAIVSRDEYLRYEDELRKLLDADTALVKLHKITIPLSEWTPPKMSHNWVVSGDKSTTGLPLLESDPQITVETPPTWYEFHLYGGRFNVRGIGMPGVPAMLIGYNDHCAWGMTALGSDNSDLFQEQLRPGSQREYKWGDTWERMTERTETILVKNGESVNLKILETRHGPVVNEFVSHVRPGEIFSLQYLVAKEPATTVEGLLTMMCAADWPSFTRGLAMYQSPGVHLIYADKWNNIAYYTLAKLPLRVHNAGIPYRGWTVEEEWQGIIPFEQMPRMLNPLNGFISTANNLPVGSWYPYDIGGGIGDNARSWRLCELLRDGEKYSPDDFLAIHRDAVNPIIRDFARFAVMAVREESPSDPDALAAARVLTDWDFILDTSSSAYQLASVIGPTIKRSLRNTPLEDRYLGGDAGLAMLFREVEAYYDSTGRLVPDPDVRLWLITYLGESYRKSGLSGTRPRPVRLTHKMPYQNNLEGFGSLAREHDLTSPPLHCGVVATIWSQLGNSYSQLVNLAQIDSSRSVLPPGVSEIPDGAHFSDQIPLWVNGDMHIAPLSLEAVETIKESEYILSPDLTGMPIKRERFAEYNILRNNYPNPFNGFTTISYELAERTFVRLAVYNTLGQHVIALKEGWMSAGQYRVTWSGVDQNGASVPSGLYIIMLETPDLTMQNKMIFLK